MSPPEPPSEVESRTDADKTASEKQHVDEAAMAEAPTDTAGSVHAEVADAGADSKNHADPTGEDLINVEPVQPTEEATDPAAKPREPTTAPAEPVLEADRPSTPVNKGKQADRGAGIAPLKSSQYLAPESTSYIDPTPATPTTSQPPSRTPSNAARPHDSSGERSPTRSDVGYDEKRYVSEDEQEGGSRSEIQTIMDQFSETGGGPGADEVMSPRLEITSPILGSPPPQYPQQHPPRKSSLEPLAPSIAGQLQNLQISTESLPQESPNKQGSEEPRPPVPPKDGSHGTPPPPSPALPQGREDHASNINSPQSPQMSVHRPPPPEPEPEPPLPFDFHRFLEQLRNKKADPVARYLKSFLQEFGKKQWMVHEQVKIIGDFLAFIANKMMQCEVWRDVSDAEFDNAREGMEKLVMNRLYSQTFSPAIPSPKPIPGAKPKRKGGDPPLGPGRRGQHQEDVERDDILAQKINIYGWVREEHLDIPPIGESGKRFLKLAQQGKPQPFMGTPYRLKTVLTFPELLKIKSYRAPRDKIICVLNCCKVIFGKCHGSS